MRPLLRPASAPSIGRVRANGRFCSSHCREADVRDRRARAREDLLDALDQIEVLQRRVRRALKTRGIDRVTGG